MFKWLKKLLGNEITDSVTTTVEVTAPAPVVTAVEPVVAESKPKKTRAKKVDTASTEETKPKRTARPTPPKQSKIVK